MSIPGPLGGRFKDHVNGGRDCLLARIGHGILTPVQGADSNGAPALLARQGGETAVQAGAVILFEEIPRNLPRVSSFDLYLLRP
jgi:hypothetical protein